MIRKSICKFVKLVKNQHDSIIWLKIQNVLRNLDDDLYLGCVYIPPSNSSFYRLYDCDIFSELENQIVSYLAKGKVMILGDLNARTSNKADFIADDILNSDILSEVAEMITYENDRILPVRVNPDVILNDYGSKLLSMCKSSGLRILNGRHKQAMDRDYTFMGARGLSVVDYCISTPEIFELIDKFIVSNFTTYSDHAPLHLQLKAGNFKFEERPNNTDLPLFEKVRWDADSLEKAKCALISCVESLQTAAETPDEEQQGTIDSSVDHFTTEIADAMEPFFALKSRLNYQRKIAHSNVSSPIDKPWVTTELKRKYNVYRSDLRLFNRNKNSVKHQNLMQSKKEYKALASKLKRRYQRAEGNMLDSMRKHNPKAFYRLFKRKKGQPKNVNPGVFYEHFKELTSNSNTTATTNPERANDNLCVFEELDCEITETEITDAIKRLKREKSHGTDLLINEYFIEFKNVLVPIIHKLFNRIFSSGFFPQMWSKSVIVPILKKGDVLDPNNYRGISLVSCFCKLFTSILNQRLLLWSNSNDVITDAQFGFQPKRGTAEAIFSLSSIIDMTLCKKKKLYCCFIDFKKAFDSIERIKLWKKLSTVGIKGKLLGIIRVMYENMKSCVRSAGMLSEVFKNDIGLLQGEVLSPILFSLYVNDFEIEFLTKGMIPVQIQELNLFVLMYADDMVIFSESANDLQSMLDTLFTYTTKWDLSVNVEKTKIVIFRNGSKISSNERWHLNGEPIEIVDKFTYLGVLMNYNGKFSTTQKQLASQGRKAMFSLKSKVSQMYLNTETMLSLFDTYVASILNYSCEVWGSHSAKDVEKVHLEYLKSVLGVRKNTNNGMVYIETGRLPMNIVRWFRIFKFWFKLLQSENCILKTCYKSLREEADKGGNRVINWAIHIKNKLFDIGLGHIWCNQEYNGVYCNTYFPIIKQRISDIFVQSIVEQINSSPRCKIYMYIYDYFSLQFYLMKAIPHVYKKHISRIRMSSHNLAIESGRHFNVARNNRYCKLCNLDIEDEFHFILKCPYFIELRRKYIKKYYWKNPSVFKLIQLLSVKNFKELCNLGKYLYCAFNLRNDLLM